MVLNTLRSCVLIPSNFQIVQEQGKYTAEVRAPQAVAGVVGALPLIIPSLGNQLDLDQVLLRADRHVTGGLLHQKMVPSTTIQPRCHSSVPRLSKACPC
jgi:hypothetical protein